MPLPRPASPRVLWNDLRDFWRDRPRHQYVAAFLAILIPIGIVTVFFIDSRTNLVPRQTMQYIESWPASRTDAEIQAKQKADATALEARRRARQEQFRRLDNNLNRLGI
ncbi:MAG TPA: hypothetical protein VIT38_09475 [Allosphingosinicella sp.]